MFWKSDSETQDSVQKLKKKSISTAAIFESEHISIFKKLSFKFKSIINTLKILTNCPINFYILNAFLLDKLN